MHISEATKRQLNTDFNLYNGNGMDRDAFLRKMNVKTYFIKPEEQRMVCCCLCLYVVVYLLVFVCRSRLDYQELDSGQRQYPLESIQ